MGFRDAVASAGPYANSLHLTRRQITTSDTSPLNFFQAGCSSWRPSNSFKALKAWQRTEKLLLLLHTFNGPLSGTTQVKGKKVKPIWILLKQETVNGSGISWAECKSAPRSRQTTTPAPTTQFFYRPDALPAAQPTASKHWRHNLTEKHNDILAIRKLNLHQPLAHLILPSQQIYSWYLCIFLHMIKTSNIPTIQCLIPLINLKYLND